jgi:beta-1,4-mannooligosaccharide/beta-1,4-mannosyl-N-acetylglucosamine phosphorylase
MGILKNAASLPNIPWEDRPKGGNPNRDEPLWRYSKNPVIPRDLTRWSNSIFNSAVVPCEKALFFPKRGSFPAEIRIMSG